MNRSISTIFLKQPNGYRHTYVPPHTHPFCNAMMYNNRLPHHHGVDLKPYYSQEQHLAVHRDYTFIPEMLHTAGYKTHMLGKWHLGFWAEHYTPTGRGKGSLAYATLAARVTPPRPPSMLRHGMLYSHADA